MSYLSAPRPFLRHIIKRAYSTKTGELEHKSTCFIPEITPTFSNDMVSKETLDRFYPHVGNRDAVGYGHNGKLIYTESMEFPYPSIRFGQNTQDVMALRAKEREDWSTLSVEDKKALYRASFCNTFAEQRAPKGYWKDYVTSFLVITALSLIISLYINDYGLPYMPITYTKDWQMAVQRRRLLLGHDNIEYHSRYNYDTNKWE